MDGHQHAHHHHSHPAAPPAAVRDPVCGMAVDPATTPHRAEHGGQAYHFCSAKCCDRFVADPERWLAPAPDQPSPQKGGIYT